MSWPLVPPLLPEPWPLDPPRLRRLMLMPPGEGHPLDIPAEVIRAALAALAQDGNPQAWELPGPDPANVWTMGLLAVKFNGCSMYIIEYGDSERRRASGG